MLFVVGMIGDSESSDRKASIHMIKGQRVTAL